MKRTGAQPFWSSVILHLIVLAIFLIALGVQAILPKQKEHVFQMIELPKGNAEAIAAPETPLPPLPKTPKIVPLPELPEPKTVKPKTTVETPVIDFEQFVKQHGAPKSRPQPTVAQATPREVPRITPPQISLPSGVSSEQKLSAEDLSALQRYSAQLNRRIEAAWRSPDLAGAQVSVKVTFQVMPDGRIFNVRLMPPSGQFAFDQSIRAAFSDIGRLGPTPTGRRHTFSMTFEKVR